MKVNWDITIGAPSEKPEISGGVKLALFAIVITVIFALLKGRKITIQHTQWFE
jgi:hypothetical protein